MKDESGRVLTDEDLLSIALEHLSDACSYLFEIESQEGIAMAVMADSALRYGEAILYGNDPRLSREFNDQHKDDSNEKANE